MQSSEGSERPIRRAEALVERQAAVARRRQDLSGEALSSRLLDTMAESLALMREAERLAADMRILKPSLEALAAAATAAAGPAAPPAPAAPPHEPRDPAGAQALVEEERRRIARELHDSVGQQLCAMRLTLAELQSGRQLATLRKRLALLDTLVAAADAELDRAVFGLHPPALGDQGLAEAVAQHVSNWSHLFGVPVDLLVQGLGKASLSRPVVAAVYRVVQESLTNVAKHAAARHVSVALSRQGARLSLSVEDDGTGFLVAARPAGRLGLVGMRERIEALGGSFELESAPGRGTTVLVSVPLQPRQAADAPSFTAEASRLSA